MQRLHSYCTSLFFLLLCGAEIAQSMEQKENQLAPIVWSHMYHHLAKFLVKDAVQLIFSFHLYASDIDYAKLPILIKKSSKTLGSFMESVNTLLKSGNATLAAEIFECGFAHASISILDIRDWDRWTVLHSAAWSSKNSNVVKTILNIAGNKTWELLTTKDNQSWTPLHYAANHGYPEVVKSLLDAASNRVQELMTIQNKHGQTALEVAHSDIKELMATYRHNKR